MGKDNKKNKKFKIENHDSSGLSAFVKRPVPTDNELESFENVLGKEIKQQEIDDNLNEIYSDKKGGLVDVKRMNIRKRSVTIVRIFKKLTFLVLLSLSAYLLYAHLFGGDRNLDSVEFNIQAPEEVRAGEEFSYFLSIANKTKFAISDVNLELAYPENYIFISSDLKINEYNNNFSLDDISAGAERVVEIRGMIIAKAQSVSVVHAQLNYMPVNFSSQFKKESSTASVISDLGFKLDIDHPSLVFIGQSNDLVLSFSDYEDNLLEDFIIEFSLPKGSSISLDESKDNGANSKLVSEGSNSWTLNLSKLANQKLNFKYLAKDESGANKTLVLTLRKRLESGLSYIFATYNLNIEAVKSDLNISLFLNDSKSNQAVSFGEELNYLLKYSNQGSSSYKDAVITLVLNGKLFDFSTVKSSIPADIRSNQAIWDKKRIESLAEIKPGDEGEIEFSIKLKDYSDVFKLSDMEISAYCQYGGDKDDVSTANKSNAITSTLNTNLSLKEEIRYFDHNNLPVGSGPLPPRVGEESSFRVYWTILNSLHEINNTKVSLALPTYIDYQGSSSVSVGSLYYEEDSKEVIWDLGKLPVSASDIEASFNITLTPGVSDLNKILVLSSGATVSAVDSVTKETIVTKSGPKTTKLEDDDIAALSNSGRIED